MDFQIAAFTFLMIDTEGYFLLLLLSMQISLNMTKSLIRFLEIGVDLPGGAEATAVPLLSCLLMQHTLAFMWRLLCSSQVQTS